VTRWALLTLVVAVVAGALTVAAARFLGLSGSRASALVAVASQWLGAWVLWSFAGGLAVRHGLIERYDGALLTLVALGVGWWQYRTRLAAGRERALAIFVGGQLAWLGFVLVQNGVLGR